MSLDGQKLVGVKVINIMEENAFAIENMVNKAIKEVEDKKLNIMDIQITGDNIFLILGEKK